MVYQEQKTSNESVGNEEIGKVKQPNREREVGEHRRIISYDQGRLLLELLKLKPKYKCTVTCKRRSGEVGYISERGRGPLAQQSSRAAEKGVVEHRSLLTGRVVPAAVPSHQLTLSRVHRPAIHHQRQVPSSQRNAVLTVTISVCPAARCAVLDHPQGASAANQPHRRTALCYALNGASTSFSL